MQRQRGQYQCVGAAKTREPPKHIKNASVTVDSTRSAWAQSLNIDCWIAEWWRALILLVHRSVSISCAPLSSCASQINSFRFAGSAHFPHSKTPVVANLVTTLFTSPHEAHFTPTRVPIGHSRGFGGPTIFDCGRHHRVPRCHRRVRRHVPFFSSKCPSQVTVPTSPRFRMTLWCGLIHVIRPTSISEYQRLSLSQRFRDRDLQLEFQVFGSYLYLIRPLPQNTSQNSKL